MGLYYLSDDTKQALETFIQCLKNDEDLEILSGEEMVIKISMVQKRHVEVCFNFKHYWISPQEKTGCGQEGGDIEF